MLRFEGIYRSAMVSVNDEFAASQPSGYTELSIPLEAFLRYGQENTIRVQARSYDDSRWYSGAGIYRDVTLLLGPAVHVPPDGVTVTTPRVDSDGALVSVVTEVTTSRPSPPRSWSRPSWSMETARWWPPSGRPSRRSPGRRARFASASTSPSPDSGESTIRTSTPAGPACSTAMT